MSLASILRRIADKIASAMQKLSWQLSAFVYGPLICRHFCLWKAAGSNFKNAHVHILVGGAVLYTNPDGYSGLSHDDATEDLMEPKDKKHNLVSKGKEIGFQPSPDAGHALTAADLKCFEPLEAHMHPAPASGRCPPGFFKRKCDCGDVCFTFDQATYEAWLAKQ